MKYSILIIPFLLVGCAGKPTYVNVPVWTPPKFEQPVRPALKDPAEGQTDGEIVRIVEKNNLDLLKYIKELEKIVELIK